MTEKKKDAMDNANTSSGKVKPVGKRRWLRRLLIGGGGLVLLVVLLVLLLPTLLGTGLGKGFVLGKVNGGIAGEVQVDSLSLGWFGGQRLSGVVVRGEDGAEVARVGAIDLPDATLWGLVRGDLNLGELRVEQTSADVVGYEDGTTNLQRALASRGMKTKGAGGGGSGGAGAPGGSAWPEGLSFGLILNDMNVSYRAHDVSEQIKLAITQAQLSGVDPEHLVMKLDAGLSHAGQTGTVQADAKIDGLFDAKGVYQLNSATADVNADVKGLPTDLLDSLMGRGGKLTALLGPAISGDVKAEVTVAGGTGTLTLASEHMEIDGGLVFDDTGIKGVGSSHISLTVTPKAWTILSAAGDKPASTLAEPVEVAIELVGFDLPIGDDGAQLAEAQVQLSMTVGDARMQIKDVGVVELKGTAGGITSQRLGSLLSVNFKTVSAINGRPGGVSLDVELTDLIDDAQQLNTTGLSAKVNGELTHAPVAAVLDELMPGTTHGLATRAFGPTVDATLKVNAAPRSEGVGLGGTFDLDLKTEGGEASLGSKLVGRFDVDEQILQADLADGSSAVYTLTPELIEAYQKAFAETDPNTPAVKRRKSPEAAGRLSLAEPTTLSLDVSEAFGRLVKGEDGAFALDPASVRLTGMLQSPQVKLDQDGQLAATLTKMLVNIKSEGLSGDTNVVMNAKVAYPGETAEQTPRPGLIESATNISGLANEGGEINTAHAAYQTVTRIQQAPIDLIDALFRMEGELIAAVGPRARLDVVGSYTPAPLAAAASGESDQANASAHGSGGFDLLLKSRTASADMKLLVVDGRWTLKADAPLSFQVTPRLSQTMLKKVNPFLGSAVSAKLPIGLTVKQEGFSVPLHEAAITDVKADIQLELGALDLRGEGNLKELLEKLGVGDRSLLNVAFSPVAISLDAGKLSYKDLTMSMDEVVLGFSGEVDLNKETIALKMTIPGSSLTNIKWLKGTVDPRTVIVIPLGGTFDRPTLDMKLLTGEIAKAALRGRLEGAAGDVLGDKIDGKAGEVVGGLINGWITGKESIPELVDPDTAEDIVGGANEAGGVGTGATDTSEDQAVSPPPATPAPDKSDTKDTADTAEDTSSEPAAKDQVLTAEEREARRERRQKRRERLERLEREKAERAN